MKWRSRRYVAHAGWRNQNVEAIIISGAIIASPAMIGAINELQSYMKLIISQLIEKGKLIEIDLIVPLSRYEVGCRYDVTRKMCRQARKDIEIVIKKFTSDLRGSG
ncbi:hypothetical protein IEQ34_006566 [Dendrobium chrysotoxum]|uniref:Uncharacterized protein n=1 Tax=Dendrobium chrysotoxum TaxID=161865 RepID=A0AAV7H6X3_DENCH|nr:hypothetical protein IEQ34_006566 [Dendrobium chrysotoxum]